MERRVLIEENGKNSVAGWLFIFYGNWRVHPWGEYTRRLRTQGGCPDAKTSPEITMEPLPGEAGSPPANFAEVGIMAKLAEGGKAFEKWVESRNERSKSRKAHALGHPFVKFFKYRAISEETTITTYLDKYFISSPPTRTYRSLNNVWLGKISWFLPHVGLIT